MLTLTHNIVIFVVTIISSMVFMAALDRFWPREKRVPPTDLIG